MKKILVLIMVFLGIEVNAQNISGIITDEKNEPVAFASVALLQANDSSFVTGATTDMDGRFEISADPGDKLLKVSYVGYATQILKPAQNMSIVLKEGGVTIGDVVITGHRPVLKMKDGALVATIEGTILEKIGNGFDVLQQLPFINGDDQAISVIGRQGAPLVYINGRKMQDWDELRQLTSDMIKEVKIIMNPGVKYDSSINSVIQIRTIRPFGEGFGGYVATELGHGDDFENDDWLSLNYRKNNMDIFLGGTYSDKTDRGDHIESYDFNYHSDGYNTDSKGKEKHQYSNLTMNTGFNYQPSSRQYVSMQYIYKTFPKDKHYMELDNTFVGGKENSLFHSETRSKNQYDRHSLTAYYSNQLNEIWSFQIDGLFAYTKKNEDSNETENRHMTPDLTKNVLDVSSSLYAIKAVANTKVGLGTLNWGMEESYTRSSQSYSISQQPNKIIPDYESESKQTSTSLFASYQVNIGNLYGEFGLKYDLIDFRYYKNGVKMTDDSKLFRHLFPNISLSYKLGQSSFAVGYRVSVDRPTYSSLQSGVKYINSFTYDEGNPLLRPSYIHDISFAFSHKDIQLMFDYYHIQDGMYQTLSLYRDNPIIVSTIQNFTHNAYSVNASYSPVISIWKPTLSVGVAAQRLEYLGNKYNQPVFTYSWKNLIELPKKWVFAINFNGHTQGDGGFYTGKAALIHYTNMYLNKRTKLWSIRIGMKDIFHTFKDNGYERTGDIIHSHWTDLRRQYVYVRFTYRFNAVQSKYKGGEAGQSELNRL